MKHFCKILFLLLFLTSCSTVYLINDNDGVRPIKENFFSYKKHPFNLKDTILIDTNSIYLSMIGELIDDTTIVFVYYRFFNTGQVQINYSFNRQPSLFEINNIKTGTVGYFKIKENDKLRIQFLEIINNGQRTLKYGKFDNGDILIYNMRPSTFYGWVPKNSKMTRYKKIKINALTHLRPDW